MIEEEIIEVGEYVRTDTGCIGKVDTIYYAGKGNRFYGEELFKNYYSIYYGKGEYGRFAEERIVKHSKNIIDLIEVGDYVNGVKVINILDKNEKDFPTCIKCINQHCFYEEEIQDIVTKEQYKQIEYIVEE